MNNGLAIALILGGISYGTPLLLAGLGELLNERGGVLNLGIEGMMLVGAACGFWISQVLSGPSWLVLLVAVLGAGGAGACMAALFAVVCLTFRANQVVAGLALTILGGSAGLSSYLAARGNLTAAAGLHQFGNLDVAGLGSTPVVGPILFDQSALVYLSWGLTIAVAIYLHHTHWGLHLRAVGENPAAADAMGVNVARYRYTHTIIGGVLAGIAGSVYSLQLIPSWSNGLTAGAGWIAIGLVIFAFWRPGLLLVGAYLFGVIISLGFTLQDHGVDLPPELFSALPYLGAIVALVAISNLWRERRLGAPAALGQAYVRER